MKVPIDKDRFPLGNTDSQTTEIGNHKPPEKPYPALHYTRHTLGHIANLTVATTLVIGIGRARADCHFLDDPGDIHDLRPSADLRNDVRQSAGAGRLAAPALEGAFSERQHRHVHPPAPGGAGGRAVHEAVLSSHRLPGARRTRGGAHRPCRELAPLHHCWCTHRDRVNVGER